MISNDEALKALFILEDYCLEKQQCEGCLFAPKDYEPRVRECLLEDKCPIDSAHKIREVMGDEGKMFT